MENKQEIEKELQKGAEKARAIAQNVIHRVRDKATFNQPIIYIKLSISFLSHVTLSNLSKKFIPISDLSMVG